jgi:phosphoserine aminotransferase
MKHNFGAGPGILPHEVLKQAAAAVIDFNGTGLSLLEISHRSPEFEAVLDEAVKLVKELFSVPEDTLFCFYKVVQAHSLL